MVRILEGSWEVWGLVGWGLGFSGLGLGFGGLGFRFRVTQWVGFKV